MISNNTLVGIHLKLHDTLTTLAQEAHSLGVSCFQFFPIKQKSTHYIAIDEADKAYFLQLRHAHFKHVFMHCSYWLNPSSCNKEKHAIAKHLLTKELQIAYELAIPYVVLHPGSAKGNSGHIENPTINEKISGIEALAKILNDFTTATHYPTILLENSAQGKKTIGNDLEDFVLLRSYLNHPEKIGFCLDTAHAFSYGYDIHAIEHFLSIVDATMGISNIKLIHFNDSHDLLGTKQDRHALPGSGNIGKETLQKYLLHNALKHIPKIIEAPYTVLETLSDTIAEVCSWNFK